MMNVLAQVRLRSTYPQMTHLLTLYWTPVRAEQSQRSNPPTPVQMPQPVRPGSPPLTTPWNYRIRSMNILHPSPFRWRQRRPMSQCWLNRGNPSLLCHVTFTNTNQRGELMATPSDCQQTRYRRTIHLFLN